MHRRHALARSRCRGKDKTLLNFLIAQELSLQRHPFAVAAAMLRRVRHSARRRAPALPALARELTDPAPRGHFPGVWRQFRTLEAGAARAGRMLIAPSGMSGSFEWVGMSMTKTWPTRTRCAGRWSSRRPRPSARRYAGLPIIGWSSRAVPPPPRAAAAWVPTTAR